MPYVITVLAATIAAIALSPGAAGGAGPIIHTGTLTFRADLSRESRSSACPPGTPASFECFDRQGRGTIRGLGSVSVVYLYVVDTAPADCPSSFFRLRSSAARFSVAGKGEIELMLGDQLDCYLPGGVTSIGRPFTVTGGSTTYGRASGGGAVTHESGFGPLGPGRDIWTGSLDVPGLEFDLAPPVVSGAGNRTVRAPRGANRVRVRYRVTARDEIDGVVSVSCAPRSGTRFKVGRTVVRCSATDSSANTATATFRITVKRSR